MSPLPVFAAGSNAAHGAIVPIAKYVADGTTVSPSFSNIPQGYQDLMLVSSVRSSATTSSLVSLYILPNGDSSNNKSVTTLNGNGSSAASARYTTSPFEYSANVPTQQSAPFVFGTQITHILNYANTTTYKTILTRWACDLNGAGLTGINCVLYPYTTAITSLTAIVDGVVNLVAGTTFTLYGVRSIGQ